jgi:hypothetical protein
MEFNLVIVGIVDAARINYPAYACLYIHAFNIIPVVKVMRPRRYIKRTPAGTGQFPCSARHSANSRHIARFKHLLPRFM